jgi:concanavalin A-like lectin/glucanase superfamily protein/IPT/TIG domain-containing protein
MGDITTGLVGYWTLDEGAGTVANDSSGRGATGTLFGAPTWTTGTSGTALSFSGTANQYVNIGDRSHLEGMTALTVAMWIKLPSYQPGNTFPIRKEGIWRFYLNSGGAGHFAMATQFNPWYSTGTVAAFSQLSVNVWHHLAATYDGANIRIYVDGSLVTTSTSAISGALGSNTSAVLLGGKLGAADPYFKGFIDGVRVYSRALAAADITDLVGVPPAPPTITSFTPTSAAVGATTVITGTNFTGTTQVRFNTTNAVTFVVNSSTQITATVPSGATTGKITVFTPAGSVVSAATFTVTTSVGAPTISSISPTSGPVGTVVRITGTNFTPVDTVALATNPCQFEIVSATAIDAHVETGDVTGTFVVTSEAGSATSATFTVTTSTLPVISGFTPTSGPVGTSVTIAGSNFTGATAVNIGNVAAASFVVNSATQITAAVKSGASTGPITVTTPAGTDTSAPQNFTVTVTAGCTNTLTGTLGAAVTVPAGQTWCVAGTVNTAFNIIVNGTLQMRPGATINFTGINEANFVGGGSVPLATDVGLWCVGDGKLDIQGTVKEPWIRATGTIAQGATSFTADRDLIGWKVGDSIILCPSNPPTVSGFLTQFEGKTITAISGRTVTFNTATAYAHPAVTIAGTVYGTEVLMMTRDVNIAGTATGRSHVFIKSTQQSILRYAKLKNMGPNKVPAGSSVSKKILGRWALHLHENFSATSGMVVEGMLVDTAGSHSYVAHASHGVTFRKCVSWYNRYESFWWDGPGESVNFTTLSVFYDRCLSALCASNPSGDGGHRQGAFMVQGQTGDFPNGHSIMRGCVAVGSVGRATPGGNGNANGFVWQENRGGGDWLFEDNLAHNCVEGAVGWQNTTEDQAAKFGNPPPITRFIAYHNQFHGVFWGAYVSMQDFLDCKFYGNGLAGANANGGAVGSNGITWTTCFFDGGGIAPSALTIGTDTRPGSEHIQTFDRCTFKGGTTQAVLVPTNGGTTPFFSVDFLNCTYSGGQSFIWSSSSTLTNYIFRVLDSTQRWQLRQKDVAGGTYYASWNCKRFPI